MNLLITGNGFDLALGYPTHYKDFFMFLHEFKNQYPDFVNTDDVGRQLLKDYENAIRNTQEENPSTNDTVFFRKFLLDEDHKWNFDIVNHLYDCLMLDRSKIYKELENEKYLSNPPKENVWITYLYNRYKDNKISGEDWINIEEEIKRVILGYEKDRTIKDNNLIRPIKSWEALDEFDVKRLPPDSNRMFRKILRNDFYFLILALNIYIGYFINFYSIDKDVDMDRVNFLDRKNINHILTFNYTDMVCQYFSSIKNICFIHGKVDLFDENFNEDTVSKNNMVLGFDYEANEENHESMRQWAYYHKFFQRILKNTDCTYGKWLSDAEEEWTNKKIKSHVYIYGHSLDTTDGTILKPLLSKAGEGLDVTIYYHDDISHDQMVTNLVDLLGVDMTIDKTRRANPYIKFQSIDYAVKEYKRLSEGSW